MTAPRWEAAVLDPAPGEAILRAPVDSLTPHPDNPRRGNVGAIADSLTAHGQYKPLIVQASTGHVLAGNHTLAAAVSLGWTHVDVLVRDVPDDVGRRILAVDNRTSDLGGYDEEALLSLLDSLPDLTGTGYTQDDLDGLRPTVPEQHTDPDDAPPRPDTDPVSRTGDVWLLGPHRLTVGDATSPDVVHRATGGAPVDLLWTDPPYGVSYVGKTAARLTIDNDALDPEALQEFLDDLLTVAASVMRPGAAYYVCSPPGDLELTFRTALRRAPLPLHQVLVWVKDRFVLGRQDHQWQHETVLYGWTSGGQPQLPPHYDPDHDTVLYGWKPGGAHTWTGGRKQTTVWDIPRPARNDLHPTMKPIGLITRGIENSTHRGALVLDVCAGSGSTLIACHHTGRTAALVELDPRYADVILRRWEEHTGVVPRRLDHETGDSVPVTFTDGPATS